MKFSYFKFLLPYRSEFFGSSILRPVIPIHIQVGNQKLQYQALVDSGADFCIFEASVGEELGLNVKSGDAMYFGGVQGYGGAQAFLHRVKLIVGGHEYPTTVGFSYDVGKKGSGILGQRGFFDFFAVKFDLSKEEIELVPKKK